MKQEKTTIDKLQNDTNYLILDNPFSNPKFIKRLSKTDFKIAQTDTYTLKLFAEILSCLNPSLLENIVEGGNNILELNIGDFLKRIGVTHKMGYSYVIEAAIYLQSILIQWKEKNGIEKSSVIVAVTEHDPKTGKIKLFIPHQFTKRILDVGLKENFSFLKHNLFKLNNNQAIKLYQFFKSWQNMGRYETDLGRFKEQFGYNTSGYTRFQNFENRVLKPAVSEIIEKTDINIKYELIGENLEGQKPRIKGLIFYITGKTQKKDLPDTTSIPTTISNINIVNTPTDMQLYALAEKLKLNTAEVQTLITELSGNYVRAYEVLQGCLNESKKSSIKSPMAYMLTQKSLRTLGIGLWEASLQKHQKEETQKVIKQKKEVEMKIKEEYQVRKNKLFTKLFQQADISIIQSYVEHFKKETSNIGFNPYLNPTTLELKDLGKYLIGEQLAHQQGNTIAQRQSYYTKEVADKYGYKIDFNSNDEVILN